MSKPLLFLVLGLAAVAYWAWRQSQVPEKGKLTEIAENAADKIGTIIGGAFGSSDTGIGEALGVEFGR